jgi:hypothetical protein
MAHYQRIVVLHEQYAEFGQEGRVEVRYPGLGLAEEVGFVEVVGDVGVNISVGVNKGLVTTEVACQGDEESVSAVSYLILLSFLCPVGSRNCVSCLGGCKQLPYELSKGVAGTVARESTVCFHAPCSTIYYSFCLQLAAFHTLSLDYTYRTMWLIFGRSLWNLKMKFQTPTSDNMLFRRLEVMISELLLSLRKPC